jgi:hypothetical protein
MNESVRTVPYRPLILYDDYRLPLRESTPLHKWAVNSVGYIVSQTNRRQAVTGSCQIK